MGEGRGRRGAGAPAGRVQGRPRCCGDRASLLRRLSVVSVVMRSSWGIWLLGRQQLAAKMPRAGPWGQAEVLPAPFAEVPNKDPRGPSRRAANSCRYLRCLCLMFSAPKRAQWNVSLLVARQLQDRQMLCRLSGGWAGRGRRRLDGARPPGLPGGPAAASYCHDSPHVRSFWNVRSLPRGPSDPRPQPGPAGQALGRPGQLQMPSLLVDVTQEGSTGGPQRRAWMRPGPAGATTRQPSSSAPAPRSHQRGAGLLPTPKSASPGMWGVQVSSDDVRRAQSCPAKRGSPDSTCAYPATHP